MPHASWSRRQEPEGNRAEKGFLDTARWQMHADTAAMLNDACGDLQEPQAERVELAPCEPVALRDLGAHGVHQPERRRMERQADLIGCRRMA